jgi:hypothetical protein
MYGIPGRVRDPATYAFAHGGKDGHPYPVDAGRTTSRSPSWKARSATRGPAIENGSTLRRLASFGG